MSLIVTLLGSTELILGLSAPIDVYSDWIDAAEAVGRAGATEEQTGDDD